MRLVRLMLSLGIAVVAAHPSWGLGAITCQSADGHVYFILRGNVANKGTQVTSVAITSGSAAACIETPSGAAGQVLTAFSAGIALPNPCIPPTTPTPSALLPNRMRTTVISGKANAAVSCANFNPNANGGTGLLTMPAGGTVGVAGGTIPLVDVHTADAAVPAAVDLLSEIRMVTPFVCAGATMVFPLPNPQQSGCPGSGTTQLVESDATTGEQDCQTVTFDDTNQSTLGNSAGGTMPRTSGTHLQTVPDGFLLQGTCSGDADCQQIVFVASPDSAPGFRVTAAGFKITAASEVFGTDSFSSGDAFNYTPTPTCASNEACVPRYSPDTGCCSCATVTPTPTPTPTPTACETFPPPTLTFQFSADPAHPVVGDPVQLSFTVSGRGGIPAYTLSGAAPVFQGDTSTVFSNQLGTVTYHLTAVHAGTATLTLDVDYETSFGCVGQPIFHFVFDTSPQFTVEVVDAVTTPTLTPPLTPTPTLTPTATPALPRTCIGDCDDGGVVTIDELILGVNIALGSANFSACRAFDCNSDCHPGPAPVTPIASVDVACLIRAVNNALDGCPPPDCIADADCDDGNSCSVDHCTPKGCTHDCVCD